MKKYRVTDANEVLRPGQEVIFCGPESRYCLSQGIFIHEIELQNHPNWYEEVKPERWKPAHGETVFVIDFCGNIVCDAWTEQPLEWVFYEKGLIFRSQEQAEEAARRVKACLLAYQEEITK